MATLYNTIERVASRREEAGVVVIDLLWDTTVSSAATNASEERTINGPVRVATDLDGYWVVEDIDLNTDISPTENVYLVQEYSDDEVLEYYVTLTSNATFWLGDVTVSKPAWVE